MKTKLTSIISTCLIGLKDIGELKQEQVRKITSCLYNELRKEVK